MKKWEIAQRLEEEVKQWQKNITMDYHEKMRFILITSEISYVASIRETDLFLTATIEVDNSEIQLNYYKTLNCWNVTIDSGMIR